MPQPLMTGYDDPEPLGAPMGACGDAYRDLVTTSGGYTPDNQCGAWCNDADHGQWNEAAKSLFHDKVAPAFSAFTASGSKDPAAMDAYLRAQSATLALIEPSAFRLPGEQARMVARTVEAMNLSVCALELLNDATASAGGTPTKPAGTAPPRPASGAFLGLPWWVWLVLIGGVAAGAGGREYYSRRKGAAA